MKNLMGDMDLDKIKQAQINGFLQAIALINLHTNHGYTFEWNELGFHEDIPTAYEYSFDLNVDQNLGDVRVIPLDDWKKELEKACDDWFFEVGYPHHQFDSSVKFDPKHCIHGFITLLSDFFDSHLTVYKVECQPNFWYEAIWGDYIFHSDKRLFLLHFGVSD